MRRPGGDGRNLVSTAEGAKPGDRRWAQVQSRNLCPSHRCWRTRTQLFICREASIPVAPGL